MGQTNQLNNFIIYNISLYYDKQTINQITSFLHLL